MSFVAVGVGLGTAAAGVAGSIIQGNAAKDAAAGQAQAAREANALQERMFNQQRADAEPWRQAGMKALTGMQDQDYMRDFTMADYQADPGYAFRMSEGQKALERSAAARGGLQSGGTLKALTRYSQGVASEEYQNAYNRFNADRDRRFGRLSSLAGLGQTANTQVGAAGQNYANQVGANTMGAANAAGAAKMAAANSWANTFSGAAQAGSDAMWMNRWMKARGA